MDEQILDKEIRKMPRDEAAELALLSSMMLDNEALVTAAENVRVDDFYRLDYRLIFQSFLDLYNTGRPVDLITLKNSLEERDVFEKVGGIAALGAIASDVSTSANIKQYIRIVLDKSILRRLISAAGVIQEDSFAGIKATDAILDNAEAIIFAIGQRRNTSGFVHIHEALTIAMEVIEQAATQGSAVTGLPSGFIDLDTMTAGFHPSDLILIAARPSMGKTALALNMVANAAIKNNAPCAIFSLEMSKESLANRLLSAESRVQANKLRTGQLEPKDWDDIAEALSTISSAPIYIDDTPGITVSQMRSKCRKLKSEQGLSLIIVDYIQLMSGGEGRPQNRQQEISEISRSLKALAREMNAPIIALSQLSRAPEARSDRRPILSDLRESGAIEQDADLVCFIYRDEYYNRDSEKIGIAEIIVAKQRNGATGTVELRYINDQVRFENYTPNQFAPF
ncbi:MAG: replicative DNA helicase [Defluviitaleaceae bacterium]|nr:replicative DNA helicase [Defluviitaleaceae bacterium]